MENKKYPNRWWRHFLSAPFIYLMIVPLVILDIFLEIYHRVCFPLYALPYLSRRHYIKIDRHKLKYLNLFDKINCAYCGYANGLAQYAVTIAAITERYWCAIKHKSDPDFKEPSHHKDFLPYGDEQAYKDRYGR